MSRLSLPLVESVRFFTPSRKASRFPVERDWEVPAGWGGSYQFRRVDMGETRAGFSYLLRPLIRVLLRYKGKEFETYAWIDSGADFSVIPFGVAQLLGIDPEQLPGMAQPGSGVGAAVGGKFVDLEASFYSGSGARTLTMPFLALYPTPEGAAQNVLIGLLPFFQKMRILFKMGFTDDPELGKWSLREVTKQKSATRFLKSASLNRLKRR